MFAKVNKILFLLLIVACLISYFTRSNYRAVNDIQTATLEPPVQKEVSSKEPITFIKAGYAYELTPLFDYELNVFIVHTIDYEFFGMYKMDSVFPADLCVVWGANVKSRVYQKKTLAFSQDSRHCSYTYRDNVVFSDREFSNNHLLIEDDAIKRTAKSLHAGDQVKIIGKLVNVTAVKNGDTGTYDPQSFTINSSTTRDDTGDGACEVIYVEDLEILRRGNPISFYVFYGSLCGLAGMIIFTVIRFFVKPVGT